MKKVHVIPHGFYIYIVAKVEGETVLRAEQDRGHAQVASNLYEEIGDRALVRVLGGGCLDFNPRIDDRKMWNEIHISGGSGSFGREPDRELTVKLLQETFPNHKVVVQK